MSIVVDVSNNNGTVNFEQVKADGAVGVWLKVSEVSAAHTFDDAYYKHNNQAARAAGLKVGGYFFGHPAADPVKSADHFLDLLVLKPGDLLPVLDLEVTDGKHPIQVAAWASAFHSRVRERIGEYAVSYAGSPFIKANGLAGLPCERWIPSYGAKPATYSWAAWQYTDGQARYGKVVDRLDASIVPALSLVTYKAPKHRRVAAKVLRKLTGYASWKAWRHGKGKFKGWGKANKKVRPNVPHRIFTSWWKKLRQDEHV